MASVVKIVVITHHDDSSHYISSEEDIVLMLQATDAFVKKDDMTADFHVNSFY